jgi:hypothetical protein
LRLISFTLFILLAQLGLAQVRLEGFINPGLGYRHLTGAEENVKDSLGNMDELRQNWSGGVKLVMSFDKLTALQVGLNYKGLSFTRVRRDLQFHDTVHPEIGRILDLSQTVLSKDAYFHHRYRYLSIPVMYQRVLSREMINQKLQFMFVGGLDFDFLLNDKTKVFLPGFSVNGEDRHTINNDYTASPFNMGINIGGRLDYRLDEHSNFSAQPTFNYPFLLTAKDNLAGLRLFQFGVTVGVNYLL